MPPLLVFEVVEVFVDLNFEAEEVSVFDFDFVADIFSLMVLHEQVEKKLGYTNWFDSYSICLLY